MIERISHCKVSTLDRAVMYWTTPVTTTFNDSSFSAEIRTPFGRNLFNAFEFRWFCKQLVFVVRNPKTKTKHWNRNRHEKSNVCMWFIFQSPPKYAKTILLQSQQLFSVFFIFPNFSPIWIGWLIKLFKNIFICTQCKLSQYTYFMYETVYY